ncbi:hypothetical protein ACO0K7_09755 [Undibacterium sp. Ji67W]|uniref:hypothetical protein n=1 Tax=Undibacterium sp. Ji67W TaxID=3413042 RepID=UPI003BF34FE2
MSKFYVKAVASTVVSMCLVGCGGGGGSNVSTAGVDSGNTRQVPVAGDSFTYQHLVRDDQGQSWTYYSTEQYGNPYRGVTGSASVLNDKLPKAGYFFAGTNTSATFSYLSLYDANGAELLFSPRSVSSFPCSYSQNYLTARSPYSSGQTWDVNVTLNCTSGSSSVTYKTVRDTGSIVGVEDVTVTAGMFSTLKEVATIKELTTYTPPGGNYTDTSKDVSRTCWRDTVSGQYVKCVTTGFDSDFQSSKPGGSKNLIITSELIGRLNASNVGVKVQQRFAGRWNLTIAGNTGVNLIEIDPTGTASFLFGISAGGLSTDYSSNLLNSSVNNDGDISITISSSSANGMNGTLSGKLDSLAGGSGVINLKNGYVANWKMSRQ